MKLRHGLFAVACLAQLAVPLSLVAKHEQTRANGTPWKFQTAPVDPGDPFRGKYVRLSYVVEREAVPFADDSLHYVPYDTRVYAELRTGEDGYAHFVRLHEKRPQGVDYVDVFTRQMQEPPRPDPKLPAPAQPLPPQRPAMFVHVPFDRWYLPEDKAARVEQAYFEANRRGETKTYAEVRVHEGHAVLVGLTLSGRPIEDVR